jgi:hypothetical protein
MYKKLYLPVLMALVAALLLSGVAHAQEERPLHGGRRGIGKITSIGASEFTLETRRVEKRTILVDEGTQYRTADGQVTSFADLQVGQWVAGYVRYNDQGQMVARLVIVLPDDYDPSQRLGRRARGNVTGVDLAGDRFTLHTFSGDDLTFQISEGTIFAGGVESLKDMEAGMQAAVGAIELEDDSLVALFVLVRRPLVRHAGTVVSVDVSSDTFTLDTRQGEQLTFQVDKNTRFRSKDGLVEGLEDLQPGMVALVVAKVAEGDALVAAGVIAGTEDQLPHFDLHVAGRVVVVEEVSFTLQARNGEQYTFKVDEETRFRSLGSWLDGLEDVKVGMRLAVGAEEVGGGYLARLVLAGRP